MQGTLKRGTVLTQASAIPASLPTCSLSAYLPREEEIFFKNQEAEDMRYIGSEWRDVCFLDYCRTVLNSRNCIPKHEHHKQRKAGHRSLCLAVLADRSSLEGTGDVGSNPRTSIYSLFDFEHIAVKSSVSLKIN